jgi:hypothetical protein
MSQISDQAGEVLQGTVPDGAIQGGAAATPAGGVGEGSPPAAGQVQDTELAYYIPKYAVPKDFGDGKDWAGAFESGKKYKGLERDGMVEVHRLSKQFDVPTGEIIAWMQTRNAPKAAAEATPQRPASGQRYNQFGQPDPRGTFDGNMQPLALDPNDDPILKVVGESDKKREALEKTVAKLQEDLTAAQRERAQQDYNTAWYAAKAQADTEIRKAASEMGITPNPRKGKWLGEDSDSVDPAMDAFEAQVERAVLRMRNKIGDNSGMPPTKAEIAFVAESLKPYYVTSDLEAAGRVADQRKHLPKGAPPRGGGGGPSRKAQPAKNIDELGQRWEAELANER